MSNFRVNKTVLIRKTINQLQKKLQEIHQISGKIPTSKHTIC